MKIKVCHLTSAHSSNDIRIFKKECVSLAKDERFEVYLIAPGESRIESNVNIIGVGKKPKNRLKRFFQFTAKVFQAGLDVDADIYHFHDPELLPYGLKLKGKGKKVIFDSHEYTYSQIKIKTYIPKLFRQLIATLYKTYESSICRKIDAVIFPCTIDGVHPFEHVANKAEIIGNFPDLSLYKPNSEQDKKYDILCAGSLTEERGITELLEAGKLTEVQILLAGVFSPPEYEYELEEKELLKNVKFLGRLNHSRVIEVLRLTKICISNIKNLGQYDSLDNLPTKVYEAMAMGLPIIMSDFAYPRKLNQKLEFAILVNPNDSFEIAGAIRKLQEDTVLGARLGNNGRKLAEKYFDWNQEVKKLIDLYLELFTKK